MKRRAHPTVNTNTANVLSKLQGGEAGRGRGGAEQQSERQEGTKELHEHKR